MSGNAVADQQREVERNREQLADTVDALHDKLDVKSHAKARLATAKEKVTTGDGKPRPSAVAAAVGVVAVTATLVWWRRR